MKKLITATEINKCAESGEKEIYVDSNTIVTPSAKDAAMEHGITFTSNPKKEEVKVVECCTEEVKNVVEEKKEVKAPGPIEFNADLIAKIVREVMAETLMKKAAESFVKECDPSGLRLVRGNTVTRERLDNGDPNSNVKVKDILNTKESPHMGAGFMSVEKSSFDWELTYEELEYIIEGTLEITLNGKTYIAKPGDVVYIPKNTKLTWSSPDCAKFFYVTYPANWAELAANK